MATETAGFRAFAGRALRAILPFAREDSGGAADGQVFVSSVRVGPRQHELVLFDERGAIIGRMKLAGRGHDIAIDPARERLAVFARRPGYFAVIVDIASCEPLATITPPEGHHFFGHGIFSADGRLLYATENHFNGERSRGVIGVYDASGGYERIGEFETHGMDAHEILLAPDGRTLVIANGGIETHPDYGRQKLNLADMRPSIVRIDSETGDLLEETVLDASLNRLSMRHMTFDGAGSVWFGCQWEGERGVRPPLVGRIGKDGKARLMEFPDGVAPLARNYIGSVVASRDGGTIATSSPIGGQVFFWDATSGDLRDVVALPDGCGVAATEGDTFLATAGDGRVMQAKAGGLAPVARHIEQFDNHLRRV